MKRILIQAGHAAPREPGFEAGTGTGGEIDFALKMRGELYSRFARDGRFAITLTPGDLPDGWSGDVALFLHADGAGSSAAHGYSFGYQTGRGEDLATRIARGFAAAGHPGGHHRDNYTADLRGYYGFRHVNAATELVIEHGFLTNPADRAWMLSHLDAMADAIYAATVAHLGLGARGVTPKLPTWIDTLQVVINPPPTTDLTNRRRWTGEGAWGAVRWLALYGKTRLDPRSALAIAYKATGEAEYRVERDRDTVLAICRSLYSSYQKGALK